MISEDIPFFFYPGSRNMQEDDKLRGSGHIGDVHLKVIRSIIRQWEYSMFPSKQVNVLMKLCHLLIVEPGMA